VAPTIKKNSLPKVAEADFYHAGCVTDFNRPYYHPTLRIKFKM